MKQPWQMPVPQPKTPLSANVKQFTFGDRQHRRMTARLNGRGTGRNARVKTHRDSRAVVWQGLPFYWTNKGFYRGGSHGNRRPLQWLIWQDATGRQVPRGHVVVFLDGDKHNFQPANLALRTKREIGVANARAGHKKLTHERRSEIRCTYFARRARKHVGLLLDSFQEKDSHDQDTLKSLARRVRRDER